MWGENLLQTKNPLYLPKMKHIIFLMNWRVEGASIQLLTKDFIKKEPSNYKG